MSDAKQHAAEIVRTLRERGHQAYFAGGCVRDLLLNREPADYDVATDATPKQVMQIFPQTFAVGEQFGVVLVPEERGTTPTAAPQAGHHKGAIEVATFRSDVGYSDGRHPDEVRFTKDPREDVQRRDFTINGMMLDPMADLKTNELLDFVGGQYDLQAGIIRAIGDPERRFAEDKLRMLRGVRFAARFDYQIDPATMTAMQKLAPKIHQVSAERVRDELTKMLTEGHARRAFELVDTTGLLREVLPEITAMKGVEQPPQYHPEGDVFVHTLLLLDKLPAGCSKTLAWGALLHDVGKPPTFRVAPDRRNLPSSALLKRRHRSDSGAGRQSHALRPGAAHEAIHAKKFLRLPAFDEHLELHRIDCLSSHGQLEAYEYSQEQLRSMPPEAIRPTPLITGRDLIEAGYEPGPRFKEVLTAVEDAQLEGRLTSSEAAMEFVRKEFPL
jgi:poly(A) polymerase